MCGFSEVLEKVKNKLGYWKGKYLTLKGKIKVLNIYALAKVWYSLECLDFPISLKKDFDKNLSDFIWNDIHQRELDVLYRKDSAGGLNLQDTTVKMKTYRVVWLLELQQSNEKSIERFLANTLIGKHGLIKGLSILYSDNTNDNLISNSFYKNAVKAW